MKSTPSRAISRPPVVAIMGHIDHGKSTLLDYIRKSNITETEAGGITQHISAYEVKWKRPDGQVAKITFLDTPGHEAFQGHRKRGANVADIAVLVVSAEDGVKPQTLEAYKHIKSCEIPFIVAITKIDKPTADIERTKQSLAESDIYVEGYGGSVPVVPISAKNGKGIGELLDMILLVSDIENFTGHGDRSGYGYIIESKMDPKKGITTVGIIKDGKVEKGQFAASQGAMTPLRFLLDADGKQVDSLSFSSPVQIVGWSDLPPVGAVFEIFDSKEEAKFYADSEAAKHSTKRVETQNVEGMEYLPVIIKADTAGSLEAGLYEINKLSRERIQPRIASSGVGTINENDVKAALASNALIFGFNTKIDAQAGALAERSGISIETFDIIYKLTERIQEKLEEREPRIEVEEVAGIAKVLKIFSVTKDKQVLGARVTSGIMENGSQVRIMRRDAEVGRGRVRELQSAKVKVETVGEETEFGALVESKIEIAPGDILERIITVTK
ncbi:translation initiation factor IF-2 [Candidatus Parcubacteria bacterium]|nr:translation initiation factor IF-2 [Candidatus Parcubacteria bacterium]